MKKYFKWVAMGLISIILLGGLIFLVNKLIAYKMETKTPEVNKSIVQIVEENKADLDKTIVDKSKIVSSKDIYGIIHEMANTLIVAEDNLIYGEIPINDDSISQAMLIIKDTNLLPTDEKEVFMNILQAWKQKDYSGGVQAHNYAWKRLHGQIGRAKELRSKYK